jgi:hypothetical protein
MPDQELLPLISDSYTKVEEVVPRLEKLEAYFNRNGVIDRRGVFVTAYIEITREMQRRLQEPAGKVFNDPPWVSRYLLQFANFYREALLNSVLDAPPKKVPEPWRIAFAAAIGGETVVLQDLLLGINAHINHDLPLSLQAVGVDPRPSKLHDHMAVNAALAAATDPVQNRLASRYGSFLGIWDFLGGQLDETATNFSFAKARQHAWDAGVGLVDGTTTAAKMEAEAAGYARLVLAINHTLPEVTGALRWFEVLWEQAAPAAAAVEAANRPAASGTPLDAVIAELDTLLTDLDAQHSRLALYGAFYRDVLRQLGRGINAGAFADPTWIAQVESEAARQYLVTLAAFRGGKLDRVPATWLIALQAADRADVLAPQVIVLSAHAHCVHDRAIALFRKQLRQATAERRRTDYRRLRTVVRDQLQAVLAIAAARYRADVRVIDDLPSVLASLCDQFDVERAMVNGFNNALALAEARHDHAAMSAQFDSIDQRALARAHHTQVSPLVSAGWIVSALHESESQWNGSWSSWIAPAAAGALYQQILGDDFDALPAALRVFLGETEHRRAFGNVRVTRGPGVLATAAATLLGFPHSSDEVPLRLEVFADSQQEHCFQILDGRSFPTQQWADAGHLVVAYGPLRFRFRLDHSDGWLRFEQVGTSVNWLSVPRFAAPRIEIEVVPGNQGLDIDVRLIAPLVGEIVRYQGSITPE